MNKGYEFEKRSTEKISTDEIPFLISSLLLREKNLGQIDLATYQKKKRIKIFELKYSKYPSYLQLTRLRKTQDYLSQILEVEVDLKISLCKKQND